MARRKWRGFAALDVSEGVPGLSPASSPASDLALPEAEPLSDLFVAEAVEGQQDERPLRRCDGA